MVERIHFSTRRGFDETFDTHDDLRENLSQMFSKFDLEGWDLSSLGNVLVCETSLDVETVKELFGMKAVDRTPPGRGPWIIRGPDSNRLVIEFRYE